MKMVDVFSNSNEARFYLFEQFKNSPLVIEKLKRLTNKQALLLACLVRELTLSEVGRGINSDIQDVALAGRSRELFVDFHFPVKKVSTKGRGTLYYIAPADIQFLKSEETARPLFKSVERLAYASKSKSETIDLQRIIKNRGIVGAIARAINIELDIPKAKRNQLKANVESLIASYSKL